MQQNGMFYINYDGCNTAEVYGIQKDQAHRISATVADITIEILENLPDYSWRNDGERDAGFHKGKILQRIFMEITDFQERIMVISFLDVLIEEMAETLKRVKFNR